MSEIDEVTIRSPRKKPERPQQRVIWPLIVTLVVVILAVAAYFLWFRDAGDEPVAEAGGEPRLEASAEPAAAEPEPEIEMPALGESDPVVRELIGRLSAHPELASVLVPDELVRRFAAAVDNIALGNSPRPNLEQIAPDDSFEVERQDDGLYVDPESYDRYDDIAEVFASLDAAGSAELYRRLEPLIDEAYEELGYPGVDFDATLAEAIRHLLATPVIEGDVELEPTVKSFHYADPRLEGLSDAQKHLLRMGPENQRLVQEKLRAIARELELF